MSLSSEQITIAVTVYNRRQYLKQAIASALDQTTPVRVIVVEDCGPDPALEDFVKKEFGSRIEYHRNSKRRGIFGNWNACLELCRTEWISILHDDDFLAPNFIQTMLKLATDVPGQSIYCGQSIRADEQGHPLPGNNPKTGDAGFRRMSLADALFETPFWFPGQLFNVALAKKVGGFRETSLFCGDWEMWAKLIANSGGAQSSRPVATVRNHDSWERGTNKILRAGKQTPLSYVQHKRVLALMPKAERIKLNRVEYQRHYLISVRFLLCFGASLSRPLLAYHVKLLLLSKPPHWRYAAFQWAARIGGVNFVKAASLGWNRLPRSIKTQP